VSAAEILTDADRQQNLSPGQPFIDFGKLRGVNDRDVLVTAAVGESTMTSRASSLHATTAVPR
jgi:hypothetical protein